ncbi:MAG: hypothetical protein ACW98D_13755 [Promethearchaeota archaeon]|jgi:pyruvate/2-oxoglutarate/acetoin dehydrogenase E1 component
MKYKEELIRAMEWLGQKSNTIFIGQATTFSGHAMSGTLVNVSKKKRYEMPVAEELQMGMSTGLALENYVPISCYPRFDFLILACNQLVNHLDKMREMSSGKTKKLPRVIIRTSIGAKKPLDAGIQHTQDYTEAFRHMLTEVDVVLLEESEEIFPAFQFAYEREDSRSTLLIEVGEYYNTK